MNSLAVPFGLTGYLAGILLYLFLIGVVLERRRYSKLRLPLLFLLASLLTWYISNFLGLLLRQMDLTRVSVPLAAVDILGFGALALMPGLLFHTHLRYFADRFPTQKWERIVSRGVCALLYGPLAFLPVALQSLYPPGPDSPMEKLKFFTVPFLMLLTLSYIATARVCRRLVRVSGIETERSIFSKLSVLFVSIPVFNFLVFLAPALRQGEWGDYLVLVGFSSSLLPTLLVTYYIYRYGFLQLVIHRGVALVLFALLSLGFYLLGIRRLVLFLKDELSAPALLVEGVFLVAILLLLAPMNRWLDGYVQQIFSAELSRYQDLATGLRRIDVISVDEELLRELTEETLRTELRAREVKIRPPASDPPPQRSYRLPLVSSEQDLGFLDVIPSDDEFPSLRPDALRIVANEVASLLQRSRLLRAKLETEKELARKSHLEQLGKLAATVAHNVKNPLSSMKTLLQLLSESPNLTEAQDSDISRVVTQIDRLSQTVSNLLHFSRLEGQQRPPHQEVDLEQLIDSVAGVLEGDFKSKGLELNTRFDPSAPRTESDELLLSEILSNLLANAVEASSPGGKIRVSVAVGPDSLNLTVEDEGPGVPEHLQESIFRPFFSTKSRGTGLGLAIVRKRVEQLGGKIRLGPPREPSGACFVVRIPVRISRS